MPWGIADVEKHNKGLSDHQKKIWVEVANSVLSKTGDDASAIKQANGVVKKNVDESAESDASDFANKASEYADKTKKSRDHNIADRLHRTAAKLNSDAGDEETANHHYQQSQSHELTSRFCKESFEAVLYAKAAELVETIRLQEAASFFGELISLNESDPKPRVETDIKGRPVVPTAMQYHQYFESMAASHIEAMLKTAQERWKAAVEREEDKTTPAAKAELRAIGMELSVGRAVLKSKQGVQRIAKRKSDKKKMARYKAMHTSVKMLAGKNPFMHMIAKHIVNHFMDKPTAATTKKKKTRD